MDDAYRGACFCGAVEIEAAGEPIDMGYCHCESCRTYSGAPVSAWSLWNADQVRVVKGADRLGGFDKTGFSRRRFCITCGGHVFVEHDSLGCTDVHPSALPTLAFKPTMHLHYAETVMPMKDGLPKMKDWPPGTGGSDEIIPE